MKKIIKFLMTIYLRTVNFFRKVQYPEKTRKYFSLSKENFEVLVNSYEYKMDPLGGLLDYVAHPDNFFDITRKEGRDCDDWARIWSLWGIYNGYKAKEWVICNPKSIIEAFKTMHVITTLEDLKSGKVFLLNYNSYGPFDSEEEALEKMKDFKNYQENLIVFSKEIPKDPNDKIDETI